MTRKYYYYLMGIFLILCSSMYPSKGWAITTDEIISRCQSAEKAIQDISLEYEWYILPPLSFDDVEEPFKSAGVLLPKDGISKHKLYAGRFIDQNGRNRWNYVFEESATIIAKEGQSWDSFARYSYDGRVYKQYQIGGWPKTMKSGVISSDDFDTGFPLLTPIGFSIFRFESSPENAPLSITLKQSKDENRIQLIDSSSKVSDFNTIRVDLLQKSGKLPYTRIYFSIDHNYTPVKYEFLKNSKTGEISFVVEVHSLEQIGGGLWFPTSGLTRSPNEERVNAFQVTAKILINQGLSEKDFDVNFPSGTRVSDQIAGREYVVDAENK